MTPVTSGERETYHTCIYRRLGKLAGTLFAGGVKAFVYGIFAYVGISIVGAVYPQSNGIISSVMKIVGTVIGMAMANLLYVIVGIILILVLWSAWKCSAEE